MSIILYLFKRSDVKKSKFGENALDREEFLKFFRELTQREELERLMALYSSGNADFLFPKDLMEFLTHEQGVSRIFPLTYYRSRKLELKLTAKRNCKPKILKYIICWKS